MNLKRKFQIVVIGVISLFTQLAFASLSAIPVQDGGRIKPFETFAREALHLVYGKETFKGYSATDIVMSWLFLPEEIDKIEWVTIQNVRLREALQLPEGTHFSPLLLLNNDRMRVLFTEVKNLKSAQEKINPFYQSVQTLEAQISLYHALRQGLLPRVWPSDVQQSADGSDPQATSWFGIHDMPEDGKTKFREIAGQFLEYVKASTPVSLEGQSSDDKMKSAPTDKKAVAKAKENLDLAASTYINYVTDKFGDYSHNSKIQAELLYQKSSPFLWAAILYCLALVFWIVSHLNDRKVFEFLANASTWVAFLFHTFGFGLRSYLAGRPPVTNMYETVVWVAWVSIIFAYILFITKRQKLLLIAGTMVAVLCTILSHISSSVLDPQLSPLEAVLRDNFWLATHVVIIVSSYGAYFLAFFLGDLVLFYFLKDEKKYATQINEGVNAIYRSIQIGTVLLVAGIILGGVWADYSWGRFWGWDPKETWAFIAFVGYALILHGRLVGWIRQFGMAVSAILAFNLVIMAWYGVNFVLGAGLHTYGFGAGGIEYVTGFCVLHLIFVLYIWFVRFYSTKKA